MSDFYKLSVDWGTGLSMVPTEHGVEFRLRSAAPYQPSVEMRAMGPQSADEAEFLIGLLEEWVRLKRTFG
jgi:hypothetical protein